MVGIILGSFLVVVAPASAETQFSCHPVFVNICATATASNDADRKENLPDQAMYICNYFGSWFIPPSVDSLVVSSANVVGLHSVADADIALELADCGTSCGTAGPLGPSRSGGCGDEDSFVQLFENCALYFSQTTIVTVALHYDPPFIQGGDVVLASISAFADEGAQCASSADMEPEQDLAELLDEIPSTP